MSQQLLKAEVPQYLPVILERYKKFKAGKFSFQNLKFSEYLDDSDHDSGAFDVYFICSNGIVPAHKLVIANVSKYIMGMFDEQPPWFPIKVHIPDLTTEILEILVDLAYSGEMKFSEEQQECVIDAMQALGWIHTDNLSADFEGNDSITEEGTGGHEELKETVKDKNKNVTAKGLKDKSLQETTGMNFVFPSSSSGVSLGFSPKRRATFDKVSDASNSAMILSDDESMEISRLPDFDLSDSEDVQEEETKKLKSKDGILDVNHSNANQVDNAVGKRASPRTSSRKSSRSSTTTQKSDKDKSNNNVNRNETGCENGSTSVPKGKAKVETKKTPAKKRAEHNHSTPVKRLKKLEEEKTSIEIELPSAVVVNESSNVAENQNNTETPTKRQRRKPKRFEEFEEIPTESIRSKSSPVKNSAAKKTSSASPNKNKDKVQVVYDIPSSSDESPTKPGTSRKDLKQKTESSAENSNEQIADGTKQNSKSSTKNSKGKKKVSSAENPLITSFFAKKDEDEKAVDGSIENGTSTEDDIQYKGSRKSVRGTKRQNDEESDSKPGSRTQRRKVTSEDDVEPPSAKTNLKEGIGPRRSSKAT